MSRVGWLVVVGTWALGSFASGCGGGDGGSECENAVEVMCARACECNREGECAFGDETGSLTVDTRAECEAFLRTTCGAPNAGVVDWGRCESESSSAACSDPTGAGAFDPPSSCDVPD